MTHEQLMTEFKEVGFAIPKAGQIIKTAKNHGGTFGVLKVTKDWKKLHAVILEKR